MSAVAVAVAVTQPPPGHPAWAAWLTRSELAYAAGRARAGEHLTARRLAKQAALRVMAWPGPRPWSSLCVVRDHGQAPELTLHGDLARWCVARGVAAPGISLSHAGGYAAALAWRRES